MVQIWPGLFVCKQVTVCPDHIWTTLYVFIQTSALDGDEWSFSFPGNFTPRRKCWCIGGHVTLLPQESNHLLTRSWLYQAIRVFHISLVLNACSSHLILLDLVRLKDSLARVKLWTFKLTLLLFRHQVPVRSAETLPETHNVHTVSPVFYVALHNRHF